MLTKRMGGKPQAANKISTTPSASTLNLGGVGAKKQPVQPVTKKTTIVSGKTGAGANAVKPNGSATLLNN